MKLLKGSGLNAGKQWFATACLAAVIAASGILDTPRSRATGPEGKFDMYGATMPDF